MKFTSRAILLTVLIMIELISTDSEQAFIRHDLKHSRDEVNSLSVAGSTCSSAHIHSMDYNSSEPVDNDYSTSFPTSYANPTLSPTSITIEPIESNETSAPTSQPSEHQIPSTCSLYPTITILPTDISTMNSTWDPLLYEPSTAPSMIPSLGTVNPTIDPTTSATTNSTTQDTNTSTSISTSILLFAIVSFFLFLLIASIATLCAVTLYRKQVTHDSTQQNYRYKGRLCRAANTSDSEDGFGNATVMSERLVAKQDTLQSVCRHKILDNYRYRQNKVVNDASYNLKISTKKEHVQSHYEKWNNTVLEPDEKAWSPSQPRTLKKFSNHWNRYPVEDESYINSL